MNESKIKKIEKINKQITVPLDKVLSLSVFDEPRPRYISKITIFDKFFAATVLPFFPRFVRPNFLTVFRLVSIPFVAFLLVVGDYERAAWIFALSALSDALDGALARTRNQITDWGIFFDPVADKLLISTVALIVISKVISPFLAITIIVLEILMVYFYYKRLKGKFEPARVPAKVKMILQCLGVFLLMIALVNNNPSLISLATCILYISVVLSFLSLFVYKSI